MQDSMYSALFGALTNEHRLNSITNNLANVNTTGYKKDQLAFKDTFIMFAHDQIMEPVATVRSKKLFPEPIHIAKPRLAVAQTDFSQGSMKMTGDPLDVALHGEGFFKVQTPDGDYVTRNGHFRQTADGLLITEQGWPVLGNGGQITIPPNAKVSINEAGQIFNGDELIDQLQVVTYEDLNVLEKRGRNLFQPRPGQQPAEIPPQGTTVAQGFLEAANVEVVTEMVNMIEAQRQFEAYTKVMQSTDALDKDAIQRVSKARA